MKRKYNFSPSLAGSPVEVLKLAQAEKLDWQRYPLFGGIGASLYKTVPEAAVDALVDFMSFFERRWG